MSTIRYLERQLELARGELREARARAAPNEFAYELMLSSLLDHVRDLQNQLRLEKADRRHEVVELRFEGRRAVQGMLPLYTFANLVAGFGDTVHAAAQKIKYGRRVRRLSRAIVGELNLQVADVAPGSSRIFVRGDLNPDLLGRSLLEDALNQTLDILQYETEEDLAGAVGAAGLRSARGLREMLDAAYKAHLSVQVRWDRPDATVVAWEASSDRAGHIASMLGTFSAREPERLTVTGEVVTLSLRGRFELETGTRLIAGEVPREVFDQIKAVHVGDAVVAQVERVVVVNTVTGTEKSDYTLLSIEQVE